MLVTCAKCVKLVDNVDPWSDDVARGILAKTCHCADDGCTRPCATMRANGKFVPVRKEK